MENRVGKVALLLILALAAYKDYKEKQISICLPFFAAIIGIVLHLVYQERSLKDILLGMSIGMMFLVCAWISRGKIGAGDGLMLMVSGLFLGIWDNVVLVMTALGLTGMVALFLVTVMRKERDYRLPFLPFLFTAYLCWLI